MARIDGNCFSAFTKGLRRPFDERFVDLMVETTKFLVDKSEAQLAYCQSDEITLFWFLNKENFSNREFWFGASFKNSLRSWQDLRHHTLVQMFPNFCMKSKGAIRRLMLECGMFPTWNMPI